MANALALAVEDGNLELALRSVLEDENLTSVVASNFEWLN